MEINQFKLQNNLNPEIFSEKRRMAEKMDFRQWKKTRRGKKRNRIFRDSHEVCETDGNLENSLNCERLSPSPYDGASDVSPVKNSRIQQSPGLKRRQAILRPKYSPKAPKNSTQFLMDDHFSYSCDFLSIESPDPWEQRQQVSDHAVLELPEVADDSLSFQMDDLNECINRADEETKAFMEKDFEDAYHSIQCDEVSRLSESELIAAICSMESKAEHFEKELENSSSQSRTVQFTGVKRRKHKKGVISQLKKEIVDLRKINEQLKRKLIAASCC
jgi:hypothetical protein